MTKPNEYVKPLMTASAVPARSAIPCPGSQWSVTIPKTGKGSFARGTSA